MSVDRTIKLYVLMPTRNGSAQIQTVQTILNLAAFNIQPITIITQASNIPRARNACMAPFQKSEENEVFAMWVDSDIVVAPTQGNTKYLAHMVMDISRERKTIICCDYRTNMNSGEYQMRKLRTLGMENEPFYTGQKLKGPSTNLGFTGASGFGLCVGWFPTHYTFHADILGEDIYFWSENPDIALVRENVLQPKHLKEVML